MPEPIKKGIQLANNITELTAIAPLVPGGAERLRAIFAERKLKEAKGIERSPIEQIETIHYARWVIIDGGTQVLFTSNFDGDIDDYLAEFAERDEAPMNQIFGNCVGWPGARPVGRFIEYVKQNQVSAEYYYGAYPQYTVKEVKRALYWKEKTEEFIRDSLPKLSDFVDAIVQCAQDVKAAEKCLTSKGFAPKTINAIRDEIKGFLKKLAVPTPEDFGK